MKTINLKGPLRLLYQEPRRYMSAIIRRNRIFILAIIYFSILMMVIWYLQKNGNTILSVRENFKTKNPIVNSNREHFSDATKISSKIVIEQSLSISGIRKVPKTDYGSTAEKQKTLFQAEEFRPFNSLLQRTDEFATKNTNHLNANFILAGKNANTIEYRVKKSSRPLTNDLVPEEKYSDLENTPLEKPVPFSVLMHNAEDFITQKQDNEWAKTDVPSSSPEGKKDGLGLKNIKNRIMLNKQKSTPAVSSIDKSNVLLINTSGCKIPKLDPFDPTVKHLIEVKEPYVCPGPPIFMQSTPGGAITINKTILETQYNITAEELSCIYQPIYRQHENASSDRELSFLFGNETHLEFDVPLKEDYANVSCNIKGTYYEQFFPLVRLKESVEKEKNSKMPPNPALNVILVGIDSISKLNFLRHFPKSYKFVNERLKPFEMNGYTKVADNTFPNLVPLLTGRFVEYWWNETLRGTMFFDDIDFIWKEYAKKGYRTFYAEDSPYAGTFNYFKRGFYDPPTDYYFRPMALALEEWKNVSKPEKKFCLKSELDFDFIYDYLKVFTQTMDTRPYFAFSMVSTITHDDLNYARWADEPTERLLDGLLTSGALDNSLLVLFSDHGLRYGPICQTYIGKYEERLPLMYIHFPQWFLDQYPEIEKKLKINQNRLITLFDIHATMLHLLDLSKTHKHRSKVTMGRSLFEEIPETRTCYEAYIESHWCPCQTYDIVSSNSPKVINASKAIVSDINSKLEPYGEVCEILEVDTIMDARVSKTNELVLQFLMAENIVLNKKVYIGDAVTSIDDYMLTLIAKPGGAVLEGTVRYNPEDNSYNVLGLSRISVYGNTSWCIDSPKMKIFCYCKTQLS